MIWEDLIMASRIKRNKKTGQPVRNDKGEIIRKRPNTMTGALVVPLPEA